MPKLKEIAIGCARCGKCKKTCPVFLQNRNEAYIARGRILASKNLLEKNLLKGEAVESFLLCRNCFSCMLQCPVDINYKQLVESYKYLLFKRHGLAYRVFIQFLLNKNFFLRYVFYRLFLPLSLFSVYRKFLYLRTGKLIKANKGYFIDISSIHLDIDYTKLLFFSGGYDYIKWALDYESCYIYCFQPDDIFFVLDLIFSDNISPQLRFKQNCYVIFKGKKYSLKELTGKSLTWNPDFKKYYLDSSMLVGVYNCLGILKYQQNDFEKDFRNRFVSMLI